MYVSLKKGVVYLKYGIQHNFNLINKFLSINIHLKAMLKRFILIRNFLKSCCFFVSLLTINTTNAQINSNSLSMNSKIYLSNATSLNYTNNNKGFVSSCKNVNLEIKSGKDIYYNRQNNLQSKQTQLENQHRFYASNNKIANTGDWELAYFLPDFITNTDSGIISTPTELLDVTNAVDILGVDYIKNKGAKCVAFVTKTLGEKYAHSKLMADRYQSAQIQAFKAIDIAGYNFVTYRILQPNGQVECVLEFSAGLDYNRKSCNLESNLLVNSKQLNDLFYNFQLWADNENMLIELATNIISKIQSIAEIKFLSKTNPPTYIKTINQVNGGLIIDLVNNSNDSLVLVQLNSLIKISDKLSEQILLHVKPNEFNIVPIPLDIKFTGDILLFKNNILVDSYTVAQ